MTVLRLVLVGAFLFSIVIADDDNFMRPRSQPFRSSQPLPKLNDRDLFHPPNKRNPWLSRRIAHNSPDYGSPLDIPDSIASSNNQASRYIRKIPKSVDSNDNMMILEPMQGHRKSSWADWVPDFFDDDSSPGPGPLIGPMEFPGVGKKVFIRQNEPLDEDTNRVVIHLIHRKAPRPYVPPVTHQSHLLQQYNQLPFFTKDPVKQYDSFLIPGKSSVLQQNEYPSKMINGNPWKFSETATAKKIKYEKTGYPVHDRVLEVSNDPRYTDRLLKQSETKIPHVIWNRQPNHRVNYYGRSLNPTESKGPATFPSTNNTSSTSDNQSNLPQSNAPSYVLEQQYKTLRRYGYQNNTRVASESRSRGLFNSIRLPNRSPQNEIPHFKQPLNLDEITFVNKAELNRKRGGGFGSFFDGSPIITAMNNYSATKHFVRSSEIPPPKLRQKLPVAVSGGLRVVPAPNLQRGPVASDNSTDAKASRKSSREEVMHNIMSMTASQSWKNVTSRSPKMIGGKKAIETAKKKTTSKSEVVAVIERRIDDETTIEEETKEEQVPMESVPFTSNTAAPVMANKTDKVEAKIKEAARKMMGLFSLWQHKVVSTQFLRELEEKQKHKKTKRGKKSETD